LTQAILPKEIDFLNAAITEITLNNFTIDTTRANFSIDKSKRGIMMNWAKLDTYNFHCKIRWSILFIFHYSLEVEINMQDIILDNGLSI
jgi:hypothetical protein